MARLRSQPGIHLSIMILLVLRRGETCDEVRLECKPPKEVSLGNPANITFIFFGDIDGADIAVYRRNTPDQEKIVDCYFKAGIRDCEVEAGYRFTLTFENNCTRGVLDIERVTEQSTGEYFCQTLDLSNICTSCILPDPTDKAEVNTQPATPDGNNSLDKKINTTQHRTDADRTSGLPTGAIAGIVIGSLIGVSVAVAVAVMVFRKRKRTSYKKRGPKSYLPTTIKDGITSSEKKPCILHPADKNGVIPPTTEHDSISSDSSQGSTTPIM